MHIPTFYQKFIAFAVVLLTIGGCSSPVEHDEDHFDAVGVEVTTEDGDLLASYSGGTWSFTSGDALHLHPGDDLDVRIRFVQGDGDRVELPTSGAELTLEVEVLDPAVAQFAAHDDHGHFEALTAGETNAIIRAMHGGHADFETNPGLPVEVVDDAH
ncbi:MAG: hypothetical protein WD737_02760 [Gemmatimonadota bacterium]